MGVWEVVFVGLVGVQVFGGNAKSFQEPPGVSVERHGPDQ